MQFKKVLMIGFDEQSLFAPTWDKLKSFAENLTLLPKGDPKINTELAAADCALLWLGVNMTAEMIAAAPNLKYIGVYATGYGRVDTAAARAKNITVCNIPGYSTDGVAELAFACILENIREIARAKTQTAAGDCSEATFTGTEISGKKFGVIGLGNIGARVADIAAYGFNADVSYYSKTRKPERESAKIKYEPDMNKVMAESDFISLHLAYNDETEGVIGAAQIEAMKPGAVLINLSPMELLDFDALCTRLANGDITFIMDHSDEITAEQTARLAKFKNCVMYPPIGCITKESTQNKQNIFAANVAAFLNGAPQNKV
ncbi:MAG: NAD(P)-binding domain-containing protein [Alphaproteobacteria bacterium]|nr:NAD(P)-binding domain-containing protein [Alphaproteobacteria bacterium]